MPGLLETVGAQPRNPSRGKPIHIARMETGLFTNRNALHDPAQFVISKFYGGYVDALIDGSNMEVSNQLTLIRRPGQTQWSSVLVPDQPNWFYDWRTLTQGVKVVVDTPTHTYIQSASTQTTAFTKTAGAGQGYYQGVGDVLYYGDGIDLQKYTPLNPNGTTWAWGTPGPSLPPTVVVTASGAAAVQWMAVTVFTTMGLLLDSNNNVQQINAVNLLGNTGQFGTTGQGQPSWNNVYGQTTTEGNGTPIIWSCIGQIGTRLPNHSYQSKEPIYDPITKCIFINIHSGSSTSGSNTTQTFNGVFGSITHDGAVAWGNRGQVGGDPATENSQTLWKPSQAYAALVSGADSGPHASGRTFIIEPSLPPSPNPVFLQYATNAGTSGTGYTPPWQTAAGQFTHDNNIQWLCLGSSAWTANTTYIPWTASGTVFSVVKSTNADGSVAAQVCVQGGVSGPTQPLVRWQANHAYTVNTVIGDSNGHRQTVTSISGTGTSGASAPVWNNTTGLTTTDNPGANQVVWTNGGNGVTWGTSYGDRTQDGTVVWMCVGPFISWAANTQWFLPTNGFQPPIGGSSSGSGVSYSGSSQVIGSGFVQAVTISGKSQTPGPPAWSTTIGNTTVDGGVTWYNVAAVAANSLVTTKSHTYAYSFKARALNDFYSPAPLGGGAIPPPGPPNNAALSIPYGSETGLISTASPIAVVGSSVGSVNTISGVGSLDPQIDTIVIWRDADGGGSTNMFELTEIPAPMAINGPNGLQAQPWSFKDFLPDLPTTAYPGLNFLIPAPINGQNNPPPAGFIPMAYHFNRIWGAVGNFVYVSGGPDVPTGNPNEAFSGIQFFQFPSPVTRIVPTATGILVFLTSDIYGILGGPAFLSFFQTPLVPGIGLLHYQALDVHGGVIYLYTADNQFISLDPSGGAQRMGGPIADKLASFNASKVFVTVHESGNDNCIIVSDGSTGWYRLNPAQFPNGNAVWSPFATIQGGAGAVLSIEVSNGVHRLLVGGVGSNTPILQRDFSTYADNGTLYTCFFTMGSINLVNPGQIAGLTFINIRATRVGSNPTVGFLLNEVSGSFTTFPQSQPYPWQIYGSTLQPSSLFSNAYYFRAAGIPALAEHLQAKVSFPAENFANEVLSLTVFGTIEQPPEE